MAIEPDLRDLNQLIDRLLRENRPDRYNTTAADWLDDVADMVPAELLPEDELRRFVARQIVGQREGQATRNANRLLRSIGETGQLVLHWWDEANDPIAIITELVDDEGNARISKERVALRAATPADLRAFAHEERDRADKDHKSRLLACDGAEYVADSITSSGLLRFGEWAEFSSPRPS